MISYEVVEKIMKFSKINFFFRSGDQKTRFSTTKFQGVFGSKTTFSQKFPENRNFAELLTGFLICKSFNHKEHIFNDFWPKFGRIFKIRINKIEKNFFSGSKNGKKSIFPKMAQKCGRCSKLVPNHFLGPGEVISSHISSFFVI